MIVAQGSRFGGYSLFVKDGKLDYVYNFLGIPPEQEIVADAPTSGTPHRRRRVHQGAAWASTTSAHGPLKLYVDDEVVAEARDPHDRRRATRSAARGCASATTAATPSAASTRRRFEFTGGTIEKVVFDVADDAYVDVERQLPRRWRATETAAASRDARTQRGRHVAALGRGRVGCPLPEGRC